MTLNHEKLAGIATQPTNCEMTAQRMSGGYFVSMELIDDGIGNSVKTSWMFRHPAGVTPGGNSLKQVALISGETFESS